MVFFFCGFARRGKVEAAGETRPVAIGEAFDGRAPKKRYPIAAVVTAPRGMRAIAAGSDRRNERRAAGERRANWRDFRYFKRGSRSLMGW
jgi:hypothetical protein